MNLIHLVERDDGAAAVEMALVSWLFLLLMFGIYDFGTLFVDAMQVQHATQAGADFVFDEYTDTGTVSLTAIQAAVNGSSPLAVTISADPARSSAPWCGCPDSAGTTVQSVSCDSSCPTGIGTYFSIIGSAPSQRTIGSWAGFPPTLATKILVRLK